ncbi:MAG: energy transducer TonB [Rhodocyclaceae bacterium]|nr:energy transducer TonB [Rhodocyclaceae bacterium]
MSLLFPTRARLPLFPTRSRLGFAFLALSLHVAALAGWLSHGGQEHAREAPRPMRVRLVEAPAVERPREKAAPPKPEPQPRAAQPTRILAVKQPSPAMETSFIAPLPPVATAASVEPAAAQPEGEARTKSDALPIEPPRFDAAYLDNPKPLYPPASRRLGEEGRVVLRVHVLPDGRPESIEIKTSSGYPRLDAAARAAVEKWRFIPARRGDEAIAAWVLVPIVFNLES